MCRDERKKKEDWRTISVRTEEFSPRLRWTKTHTDSLSQPTHTYCHYSMYISCLGQINRGCPRTTTPTGKTIKENIYKWLSVTVLALFRNYIFCKLYSQALLSCYVSPDWYSWGNYSLRDSHTEYRPLMCNNRIAASKQTQSLKPASGWMYLFQINSIYSEFTSGVIKQQMLHAILTHLYQQFAALTAGAPPRNMSVWVGIYYMILS